MKSIQLIAFDLFGVVISDGHLVTNGLLPLLPHLTKAAVKPHYDAYTRVLGRYRCGYGFTDSPTFPR